MLVNTKCLKKLFLFILAITLLPSAMLAQAQIETLSVKQPQMLRISLVSLEITDRVDLKLDGVYTLEDAHGVTIVFERGSEITVIKRDAQLYVYYMGMSWNAGKTVDFKRYRAGDGGENGLRLMDGANLYEGDLSLSVKDELIRAILTIHLEDYLLGVVPYEMSESFPIEALKAQAVAARTYAVGRMNPKNAYDLVDTPKDQVYKGRNFSHENAARAVNETRGVCAFYGNKLAQCYYTASNGGQTEKVSNVWGGSDLPYLVNKEDPYDVENAFSIVQNVKISKKAPDFNLDTLSVMLPQLKKALKAQELLTDAAHVRVDTVDNMVLQKPMYKDSLIMTELAMDVTISGKKIIGAVLPETTTAKQTQAPAVATENIFAQATPEATETPIVYSDFIAVPDSIHLVLPLFPDLDNALNLSINSSENEIISLEESKSTYSLSARRYGHGIGMSQRGAQQMASATDSTFEGILAFYYQGITLKQFEMNGAAMATLDPEQLATPAPKATATPRPTLMPVTGDLPKGAWYAKVTGVSEDSSLNLRKEPSTSGEILMRLYKNQVLVVLEKCDEEGFVKVKTDVCEGYVMESFLTKVE